MTPDNEWLCPCRDISDSIILSQYIYKLRFRIKKLYSLRNAYEIVSIHLVPRLYDIG